MSKIRVAGWNVVPRHVALGLILLLLGGCGLFGSRKPDVPGHAPAHWRAVASEADRERLRGWRPLWVQALAGARRQGLAARIAAEGRLLDPDGAEGAPMPPPGRYRCRSIRLGGDPAYVAQPPVSCRIVTGTGLPMFETVAGPQRLQGRLYADRGGLIFLGSTAIGDETRFPGYGRDHGRDRIGRLEKMSEGRWRLVFPQPAWGGMIEIVDIVLLH